MDSTTPSTAVAAPQIRSRITVVCAECKRLKLKCDRRNPCGSCMKRDTVARCIYSPAAAEKVDLHSLNNRLIQVEATLAQLTSGSFMPSYPFSAPSSSSNGPPPPSISLNVTPLSPPTIQHSSLALPLDEIGMTWLNEIDLGFSLPNAFSSRQRSSSLDDSAATVKVEDSYSLSHDIDMTDRPSTSSSSSPSVNPPSTASNSPNIASLSISSINGHTQIPSTTTYYPSSSSSKPQLTPALIALLPSLNTYSPQHPSLRTYLTYAEESSAYTYPFLNWNTLRERALELLVNARPTSNSPSSNAKDREMAMEKEKEMEREKREKQVAQARQVFMGGGRSRPVFGTGSDVQMEDSRLELYEDQTRPFPRNVGHIPLFAALCAAIALGALEAGKTLSRLNSGESRAKAFDPAYWYNLSVQAIGVWEAGVAVTPVSASTDSYETDKETATLKQTKEDQQNELDYITACLLQLTFLAKDGLGSGVGGDEAEEKGSPRCSPGLSRDKSDGKSQKGVAAIMFPLIGKLVNYARQMSLNKDPEDIGPPESQSSSAPDSNTTSPSGAKKAKKLSDPSSTASFAASRAARDSESRFTLYEAEIRRRMWWTIMYYDLFVSDIMSQPPLISDTCFNTKRPVANVDEKCFGPASSRIQPPLSGGEDGEGYYKDGMRYFDIRSRLTLLVRNVKRRMNTPEFGHAQQVRTSYYGTSPNSHCYSIDQAASMEAEVRAWLNDLPSYYHIDHKPSSAEGAPEPILIAQRCEVALTAHRLVLRVYLPFLRKHASGVPHQASLGSINAAHEIVKAAKVLAELWESQSGGATSPIPSSLSPALLDFYPFARCVFDAAVVCAHAVIKQPSTMWAAAAMEDVDTALEIMKGIPQYKFGSAVGAAYVINPLDCNRIIEALKAKAEGGGGGSTSSGGGSTSPTSVPSKRKHNEVDGSRHSPPPVPAYVYPTIPAATLPSAASEVPNQEPTVSPPPASTTSADSLKRQLSFPPVASVIDKPKEPLTITTSSPKGATKEKKQKKAYPAVGFRKRPAKDSSPLVQSPVTQPSSGISPSSSTPAPGSRRQSISTASTATTTTPLLEKTTGIRPMYPNSQPSPASSQPPPSHFHSSAAQEHFSYRSRSSSLSQDPRLHLQRPRRDSVMSTSTDYSMATFNPAEEQSMDISTNNSDSSPRSVTSSHTPDMHQMQSSSSIHTSHSQPLPQSYVDATAPFEVAQTESSYDFPFNSDGFGTSARSSFDHFSSSNPFSNSGGAPVAPVPTSTGPYNNTSGPPTFGPQSHGASPPFSQKQPEFYNSPAAMFSDGYDSAPPGATQAQPGIVHGHGDVVMPNVMGDGNRIFDQVHYEVKPSIEELNDQHRQHQQRRQQQHQRQDAAFQGYPGSHSDPRSMGMSSSSQVWNTPLPPQGHIPLSNNGTGQYWADHIPITAQDNQSYYTT